MTTKETKNTGIFLLALSKTNNNGQYTVIMDSCVDDTITGHQITGIAFDQNHPDFSEKTYSALYDRLKKYTSNRPVNFENVMYVVLCFAR